MLWMFILMSHAVLLIKTENMSKLVKSILKSMQHAFTHAIPADGYFPSQLIVGSVSEWMYDVAGCLLERTLPWQREHGPDLNKKNKNVQTRELQCRLYIQVLRFQYSILFPWFHLFSTFFLPLGSLPILFRRFPLHWKYLQILICQLFHLVHGTSICSQFWGCKCSYRRW